MKRTVQKRFLVYCLLFLLLGAGSIYIYFFKHSAKSNMPISDTRFALNTVVTITLYDTTNSAILENAFDLCEHYETVFSRTLKTSELYKLNHSDMTKYTISKELSELIHIGLKYSKQSNGAFDISIAPISQLWDFASEPPVLPKKETIQEYLSDVGYRNFNICNTTLNKKNVTAQIDLGALAKGYIADRIKDYLLEHGVKSALINLGGNILCVGNKDGKMFHVGVQAPFKERNITLTTLDVSDRSIVTSGIYERCFTKDGKFYHHILNPKTGYPYDNGLSSVTILSTHSVDGDALSTTCFALGLKKGMQFINSIKDADAIFVTTDGSLHYSKCFKSKYLKAN